MHLQADPTRAAELRQISVGKQGWLNEVWPDLQLVRASASGVQFSAPVPKVCICRSLSPSVYIYSYFQLRHAFGDSVSLRTRVLGSSECSMGVPYDASDLNLYKIRPYEYMEFLPSEEDSYEHLVPAVRHSPHLSFSNDADDYISVSGTSKLESNMKSLLLLKMGSGATVLGTLWRLLDSIQRTACPSFGSLSVEGKFWLFLG